MPPRGGDDGLSMRLVSDEFDEESLSDNDTAQYHHHRSPNDNLDSESLKIKKVPCCAGAMGGCGQITIFTMTWLVLIGVCMLFIHIVAYKDPNRQEITMVALAVSWILLVTSLLSSYSLWISVSLLLKQHRYRRYWCVTSLH